MKFRSIFMLVFVTVLLPGCSIYHAIFTKVPGIYMTQQGELGGRLELREDHNFWYYWEMETDTFGTSNGCWYKKFNKVILQSLDSTSRDSYEHFNVLEENYNDSIDYQRVLILNDKFYPLYQAAWILKRGGTVIKSGLTDKDGAFSTKFRGRDSLIVSYPGFNPVAYPVGAGGINEIIIQMLKGNGGEYVEFKDVRLKIRKKKKLERMEGGEGEYLGDEFYRYFDPLEINWP